MMEYDDFYDIAEYGNENWKGCFTPREVANNAYDYKVEYDYSIKQGKPTRTMIELCKLVCEDMDYADYSETNSQAFGAGECVGNYRKDDMWIAKDLNGKKWRNLTTNLRNENFYKFINQYSMSDIIYYLMDKNADYQTVMTDMLVEAIETTFEETRVCCIDDIYNYISENLI